MGLFSRGFERKESVYDRWIRDLDFSHKSRSGPVVSVDSAFKVAVAFACIRKLAQGCAQVPFKLFQSVEMGGLEKILPARDHSLYDLVSVAPNGWTTSYEFRETLVIHAALGNAYVYVNRLPGGEIGELILLNPALVKKEQLPDYSIVYKVSGKNGGQVSLPASSIWHVRGPSWDGVLGMDVLRLAREALGLALATEQTHSGLHANGVQASGTYSVDGTLSAAQHAALMKWIKDEHAGVDNAGMPLILDHGAKWLQTTMSGLDAQHLETRAFQITEVCRFLDVMPIMVGYSDKAATYASAEQMFLAHVVHTLSPWYARIEQSADLNLLSKKERKAGYYFKFLAGGLLRGAAKDRAEYFTRALGSGGSQPWMTADEVRAMEEFNPFGGTAAELPPRSSGPASPAQQGD